MSVMECTNVDTQRDALARILTATLNMSPEAFNGFTRDRIGGSDLAYMRTTLVEQGAVCASCGLHVDTGTKASASVWSHLVPARWFGGNGGWIPQNVVVMCWTCNTDAGDRLWNADMLMRPDIAFLEWPKRSKGKRNSADECKRAEMARICRSW